MAHANDIDTDWKSCTICMESNEFRVLQCGHCFCVDCLEHLYTMHEQRIVCPMDRQIDEREPKHQMNLRDIFLCKVLAMKVSSTSMNFLMLKSNRDGKQLPI